VGWVERAAQSRAWVRGELRLEDGTVLAECRSLITQAPRAFLERWDEEGPFWRIYSDEELGQVRREGTAAGS
jgi:hypothetical protein